MAISGWEKLRHDLLALDRWGDFDTTDKKVVATDKTTWMWANMDPHPVNLMVNGGVPLDHFETYLPTLLRALNELTTGEGLEMVVRVLTQKGLTAAVPGLLKLFSDEDLIQEKRCLWVVGNAIYTINPRNRLDECIRICQDRRLGDARHRLIVHLSRFIKSEEAYQALVSLLEDDGLFVRGAALEALKRYGDIRAIAAIERTPVQDGDDGIYETHQKKMALKKLNEKKLKS